MKRECKRIKNNIEIKIKKEQATDKERKGHKDTQLVKEMGVIDRDR